MFIPVTAPHPVSQDIAPIVMGHEFSGQIDKVGPGVTRLAPGDPVVVEAILSCACTATLCPAREVQPPCGGAGLSWIVPGGGGGFRPIPSYGRALGRTRCPKG
ncbi:alcohol dehydrogenase catalytic domain-containing protein [Paracoccus sp. DMF-8]|uniref:alcohol dehydrogenase catalytic domain-containing protein n=1 Tax=Paracoccus sp. DMF-8 TaxID=3019445 RepID=UPI0023E8CA7F|nr:alcohol dehydrogenase catalytic domain-containing protein [Paracoccus sp. DMF-8]MDF3605753.1 alcohol dehydrogenase catalytic domain-containing protein [Paracoccus sp. DMF-8]